MRAIKVIDSIEFVKSGNIFVYNLDKYDHSENCTCNAAFHNTAMANLKFYLMHLNQARANGKAVLRSSIEDTIEYLINLLDDLEGDADLEADVDGEADARDLPRSDFGSGLLCTENEAGWPQAKNLQIAS